MTNADILTNIKQHLAELDGLQDALQANVAALQKKADALQPLADQYDEVTAQLSVQKAALASATADLDQVKAAHAQFVKIATGG